MDLHAYFKQELPNWKTSRPYLVGFSGGLDSSVLLHLLVSLKLSNSVIAIHINHKLSPNANAWQQHCKNFCAQFGVDLLTESVCVESTGYGLESAARQQRYQVFEKHIEKDQVLLLGHHLDDQIETMLFRLMRGTGPKGLAGIARERRLGEGSLVRPLLAIPKSELQNYGKQNQLSWIEDESNDDSQFDRNYLRNDVIPLLEKRWPNFSNRWLQTAESCREENLLCQNLAEEDLRCCDEVQARWGVRVSYQALTNLSKERRNNLLRTWIAKYSYSPLENKHLAEIDKQFFNSESIKAEFAWGNGCLRRYKKHLYLTPVGPEKNQPGRDEEFLIWHLHETLILHDGSKLSAKLGAENLNANDVQLTIRWRRGGERCKPQGRGHSQSVKKLLQEYDLEPWLRDRVPLIYYFNDLIAVGDLWVCELDSGQLDTKKLKFSWLL